MSGAKIRILYMSGWGRSGTTLLANILGSIEGFFAGGELRYLWQRGLTENRYCSCGSRFRECAVWKEVVSAAFHDPDPGQVAQLTALHQAAERSRYVPLILSARVNLLKKSLAGYLGALDRVYRVIQTTTGCTTIVD